MLRSSILLALLLFLFDPAFAASPADALKPSQPWVLDYAESQCIAARTYGTLTLAIIPAPNGSSYELRVLHPGTGPAFAIPFRGSVDFGQGPVRTEGLLYPTASKKRIYEFTITAAEIEQARTASVMTLRKDGEPDMSFELHDMSNLISGLRKCAADLLAYWHMSPEEARKVAIPPKGDVRRIFTSQDYPLEALISQQEGTAQYLLLIDEKGAVAACHLVKASGITAFDAMGCQVILERAKFKPALDSRGKPIRSGIVTPPISWRMGN
jgi:hypothetical protein